MNVQARHPYEGLLHKYTNAMKGWQYRWFILSPETGELHYFLSESEKNQRPRCSIYLAGAVIAPSDEDSNTFTVNSATGESLVSKSCYTFNNIRSSHSLNVNRNIFNKACNKIYIIYLDNYYKSDNITAIFNSFKIL